MESRGRRGSIPEGVSSSFVNKVERLEVEGWKFVVGDFAIATYFPVSLGAPLGIGVKLSTTKIACILRDIFNHEEHEEIVKRFT